MAKRFSDTDKWKKPFIRSLQAPYKLLWLYILDDCDHAGVWQVDMEIANIKIGENLNTETALKQFGDKMTVFDSGEKWFIKEFIDFHYGLSASYSAHAPNNSWCHTCLYLFLQRENLSLFTAPIECNL